MKKLEVKDLKENFFRNNRKRVDARNGGNKREV